MANGNSAEELENHLHQQLAENDNNRINVFTSFIVGIIALFGFYGYVYVNTCKREWFFYIDEFLIMSFVTIGILCFLAILVLDLGYSFRRDQFIVDNIRKKRYKTKTKMEKIFGKTDSQPEKTYSPSGKRYCDFLPGFYNLFYWLFFISEIFIGIITIKKVILIFIYKCSFFNCKNMIYFILFIISLIIFIFLTLKFRCCYLKKYEKAEQQLSCPR